MYRSDKTYSYYCHVLAIPLSSNYVIQLAVASVSYWSSCISCTVLFAAVNSCFATKRSVYWYCNTEKAGKCFLIGVWPDGCMRLSELSSLQHRCERFNDSTEQIKNELVALFLICEIFFTFKRSLLVKRAAPYNVKHFACSMHFEHNQLSFIRCWHPDIWRCKSAVGLHW